MKLSKIILIVTLITILMTIGFYIKNEVASAREINNFGKRGVSALPPANIFNRTTEYTRNKNRTEIFLNGGSIIIFCLICFFWRKRYEDGKRPIVNLDALKEKGIITQLEYEKKI